MKRTSSRHSAWYTHQWHIRLSKMSIIKRDFKETWSFPWKSSHLLYHSLRRVFILCILSSCDVTNEGFIKNYRLDNLFFSFLRTLWACFFFSLRLKHFEFNLFLRFNLKKKETFNNWFHFLSKRHCTVLKISRDSSCALHIRKPSRESNSLIWSIFFFFEATNDMSW